MATGDERIAACGGAMERVFWALLERAGPRRPRDCYTARDILDLIHEGRIGDALVTARHYDRWQTQMDRARAQMDDDGALRGAMDEHGALLARPEP